MLLAIDSGADTGWAIFGLDGVLDSCGLGEPDVGAITFDLILIESPRLRPRGEKNPNAVLKLARNAGEWFGRYVGVCPDIRYVSPGTVPKKIANARTFEKLNLAEQITYQRGTRKVAPSKRHNVLDAIAIGLKSVGR